QSAKTSLAIIGRLTAIDGATIVSNDLNVLGFGAKIKPKGDERPLRVRLTGPFEMSQDTEIGVGAVGGTRHQSAAQFVYDQRGSIAFVASQDSRLSVMRWDPVREQVSVIRPAEFALL